MKNYQRLHYNDCHIQKGDGNIPVSKRECFTHGEPPTPENPHKQKWYYDPESKFAVRMERSEKNEKLCRWNDSSLRKGERNNAVRTEWESEYEDSIYQDCYSRDAAEIIEDKMRLEALLAALDKLEPGLRELAGMVAIGTRKNDIAEHFGLSLDGVRYREQKLYKILRADKALKSFFEND